MLNDFKNFIMKGNVIDLAVAIIIGIAFGAVIQTFTDGVLMAFIAALVGEPNFDAITIDVGDGTILIGTFLTALVNFLIIGFSLFMIIRTYEQLEARRGTVDVTEEEEPDEQVTLLREMRDLLKANQPTGNA